MNMKKIALSIVGISVFASCSFLMVNTVWGCGTCTKDSYTAKACFCSYSESYQCSVKKEVKECEGTGGSCVDSNKYAGAYGSQYESSAYDYGRRCNGADYCSVIDYKGVNYTGQVFCYVIYYGCN